MNNKKHFSVLTAFLTVCLLLSLVLSGCSKSEDAVSEGSLHEYQYSVKVVTEGGMPLKNVQVKVFNRGDGLVHAGYTDGEGSVSFSSHQTGLNAVISKVSEGYKYNASYPVAAGETTITVETFFVGTDIEGRTYPLGSIVDDFSVTDVNGNTHKVSELLKTKKAIVLNFWFENCGPCRMEFPYLNEAYADYKDELEVIAISPVDSASAVAAYASEMKLDFPMASGELEWEKAFGVRGYPTTVVIDRYGMVAMSHTGAVTDKDTFVSVFDYFTKDDYRQKVIYNLSELE